MGQEMGSPRNFEPKDIDHICGVMETRCRALLKMPDKELSGSESAIADAREAKEVLSTLFLEEDRRKKGWVSRFRKWWDEKYPNFTVAHVFQFLTDFEDGRPIGTERVHYSRVFFSALRRALAGTQESDLTHQRGATD